MSDRVSPRAPRAAKPAPIVYWQDQLPDPPDNPEFLLLSPEKQEQIAERFRAGIALTEARDYWQHGQTRQAAKDLGRRIRSKHLTAPLDRIRSKPLTAPLDKIARGRKVRA